MQQYIGLVDRVLSMGKRKPNRTGVDTIYRFAEHMRFNLRGRLPIVTTKYVPFDIILKELIWYLRGEDHIRWLRDEQDVHIWDEWAEEESGYLGPAYSILWRKFPKIWSYETFKSDRENYIDENNLTYDDRVPLEAYDRWSFNSEVEEYDQIQNVIDMLNENPTSRRIVLSTWYPGLEDEMGLPPCHLLAIWNCEPIGLEERMNLATLTSDEASLYVSDLQGGMLPESEDTSKEGVHEKLTELKVPAYRLNCHLTQRSADIALGVPFNITCYSALTKILAHLTGMVPGEFSHLLVDAHIYVNHIDGLKEQMKQSVRTLPELEISRDLTSLDQLQDVDAMKFFELKHYEHGPKIKFEVAV